MYEQERVYPLSIKPLEGLNYEPVLTVVVLAGGLSEEDWEINARSRLNVAAAVGLTSSMFLPEGTKTAIIFSGGLKGPKGSEGRKMAEFFVQETLGVKDFDSSNLDVYYEENSRTTTENLVNCSGVLDKTGYGEKTGTTLVICDQTHASRVKKLLNRNGDFRGSYLVLSAEDVLGRLGQDKRIDSQKAQTVIENYVNSPEYELRRRRELIHRLVELFHLEPLSQKVTSYCRAFSQETQEAGLS